MANVYLSNGLESLEGRDVFFKNGAPVNSSHWDFFKHELPRASFLQEVAVSKHLIEQTFNPIYEMFSGRMMRSPNDMFKKYCEENDLQFMENQGEFIVRWKRM